MSKKKILFLIKNEYIYSILTKFLMVLISLGESVLLARFLGATLKGTSTYITSITSIGSIVITFGMHQAYPYLRKKYGKDNIYQDYITAIFLLYGIYFVIALIVGLLFVKNLDVSTAIILTPFLGYANVINYVCLVESPNKKNTIETIVTFLYLLLLLVLFLCVKSNYFYMVVTLVFAAFIRSVVYTFVIKPKIRFHKGLTKVIVELFRVGFFPMLALLMTTLNYQIDVLMMKSYMFITAANIGVYSIGISVSNKIVLIPDTLKGVLVSKLAKGADEFEVARVLRLCFCSSCILCVAFLLLGNWAINLLYGDEYTGAYVVMAISALGAITIGYFKLIAQYNIVNGLQKYTVLLLAISICLNVILNLIFIPLYKINGAAIATCFSHIVCGIVFSLWFSKKGHINFGKLFFPQKDDFKLLMSLLKKNEGEK